MTLTIRDRVVRGFVLRSSVGSVRDVTIVNCEISGCSIGIDAAPNERLILEHCSLQNSRLKNCFFGPVVLIDSVLSNVRGKSAFCYGTAFQRVTFEGDCGVLTILPVAVPGNRMSLESLASLLHENRKLELEAKWSVDLRNAKFLTFEAYGLEVETVRAHEDDLVLSQPQLDRLLETAPMNSMAALIASRVAASGASEASRARSAVISCRRDAEALQELRDIKEMLHRGPHSG